MKHQKLYHLVLAALFAALTYVATNIIRVPIPATDGYINLGDCVVLLGAFLLGPVYGAAAGGIGSALADIISGYAVFAPGTFVIKALIAVIAAAILRPSAARPRPPPSSPASRAKHGWCWAISCMRAFSSAMDSRQRAASAATRSRRWPA